MRGCAVIFNHLIASVYSLKCRDEGRRGNDRLHEGKLPSALHEKHAGLLKKGAEVFKKHTELF